MLGSAAFFGRVTSRYRPGRSIELAWPTSNARGSVLATEPQLFSDGIHMLKRGKRIYALGARMTAVAALTIGAVAAVSAPASADVGDGNLSCRAGEICFKKNNDGRYEDY